MKKILKPLLALILSLNMILPQSSLIKANQLFTVTASSSSVEPQTTVKITVTLDGEGLFTMNAVNATLSTNSEWIDKTLTFNATVGQEGTAIISVTAEDAVGYDTVEITGTQTITISIKEIKQEVPEDNTDKEEKPEQNNTPTQDNTQDEDKSETTQLSSDNNLKTITVSKGTLTPSFDKDTHNYKVYLSSDTTSIQLSATANDPLSTVTGIGTISLSSGIQSRTITVKAENGETKTYTITFEVEEKPLVYITYDNQSFLPVTDVKDIPAGFEKSTVTIDEQTIESYKNEKTGIEIVCLKNENNEKDFYIVENNKIVSLYKTITIQNKTYIIPYKTSNHLNGFIETEITINDQTLKGWKFEDERFENYYLISLINESGEQILYMYEVTEGTLQKYVGTIEETPNYIYIVTAVLSFTTLLFIILYISSKRKKSKKKEETILTEETLQENTVKWPTLNDIK